MVRFWTVNVTPVFTEKTRTLFPPLIVIRLPPSMVVLVLMVLVLVTVIDWGIGDAATIRTTSQARTVGAIGVGPAQVIEIALDVAHVGA